MALVVFDRVQESTTTAGTGSVTLDGAVAGFQSFAVVGNGNTTYYAIVDTQVGAWEVGIGTYSTTGPTLARTTILSNSNGNTSPITLSSSANTKSVFVTYPAEKSVNLDQNGNVILPNSLLVENGVVVANAILGGSNATAQQNQIVFQDGFGTSILSLKDGDVRIRTGTTGSVEQTFTFDSNGNITGINNVEVGLTFITSAGGTTNLTIASTQVQVLVGSANQTIRLPDATTLSVGFFFTISNASSGVLTVEDYTGTVIETIAQGGAAQALCTSVATVAGSWGFRVFAASNVTWGNANLDYNGTITSATWNGNPIPYNYGGTTLTTFGGANNAIYSTSATALTAGTLPAAAGGTGLTSPGTTGNVLTSTGTGWASSPVVTISADDAYFLSFMMG